MSGMGCWGCLFGVAIALGNTFNAHCVAQITPDGTLPNNSIININGNTFNITGGTQAGANLFHSFQEFSVRTGSEAFFNNTVDIQNIISRVTGGSISNIDGLIRTLGTANLFLINPNGIIFGPNASLNVGGSFVATTANAIQFGNIGFFSADNPNAPTPLLTINPSALLFNQLPTAITNRSIAPAGTNPAGVEVTGLRVPDGKSLLFGGGNINLEGGALRAYGGRVELTGLAAPGVVGLNVAENILSFSVPNEIARADISLTNAAEINVRGADGGSIAINAQNLSLAGESKLRAGIDTGLGTPQSQAGDIDINATGATTLTDGSFIANVPQATSFGKGGNVNITTGSLALTSGSYLNTNNFGQGDGGNINLNVRDALTLAGVDQNGSASAIVSNVQSQAVGNGGNINIQAGSVSLADAAYLTTSTSGKGDAGNVSILASDAVSLSFSDIYSNVRAGGVGNGGNINITASSLSLKDGAQLQTSLSDADTQDNLPGGRGNAGNVNIDVRGAVTLAGVKDGFNSAIFSNVGAGAEGNGGNITIKSGSLSLTDAAYLEASTYGQGNAGSVFIQASDSVFLEGGKIYSNVEAGGVGKGGDINITASSLSLKDGAQLQTLVRQANAENGLPAGQGNAGNVNINVRGAVTLAGSSAIFSTVGTGAEGNGGNITVKSSSLSLTDAAYLETSTYGKGNAGSVSIQASDAVSLEGGKVYSNVEAGGVGKGGDINITASSLSLKDGAQLQTLVRQADTQDNLLGGRGNGGNVNIDVRGAVTLAGSSAIFGSVGTGAEGNGGNITVKSGSLFLTDTAYLETSTFGKGDAGSVFIQASDAVSLEGGKVYSNVEAGGVGKGGDINITASSLSLKNGAQLAAVTFGQGNAGNISINARDAITFNGTGSNGLSTGVFSTVESGGVGNGGDIQIKSGSLSLVNQAQLNSSTLSTGDAGNISVMVDNAISLNNSSYIRGSVGPGGIGQAGDIDIQTRTLELTNGAEINSALFRPFGGRPAARGSGGNIRINALDSLTLSGVSSSGFSSGIFTANDRQTSGPAGNIIITTDKFAVRDGAIVSALTSNSDIGGNITINARTFEAINGGQVNTNTRSSGNAGTIRLNVRDSITLSGSDPNFVERVAQVRERLQQPGETDRLEDVIFNEGSTSGIFANTAAGSTGQGGSIFINPARRVTITDGAKISVNSDGTGNAGDITLRAGNLTLDNQASISAQTASSQGGNINLNLGEVLLLRRGSQISATAGTAGAGGDGGNITIDAPRGFIVAAPNENSDITANAFSGQGGNVTIRAAGIFNIAPLSRQELERLDPDDLDPNNLPTNDITAISQQNPTLGGQISINTPDADPNRGLVELPAVVVDTSNQIDTSCAAFDGRQGNQFTVTGRGGLPPNPYEPLTTDVVWLDTRLSAIASQQQRSEKPAAKPPSKAETVEIVPATGWVFDGKGKVTLISHTSSRTSLGSTPAGCAKQ